MDAVRAALEAGADWVQVRTKSGTDRERLAHIRTIADACDATDATCVVNDRADLARAGITDGVHVGLDDLPVPDVRRLLPRPFVVGATARNADQARRAEREGADYLGVGPVWITTTKTGLPDPLGLEGLAAVVGAVGIPVLAIGGITPARVADVLAAGAHGVAVVGAVFGEDDVAAATRRFVDALGPLDASRWMPSPWSDHDDVDDGSRPGGLRP